MGLGERNNLEADQHATEEGILKPLPSKHASNNEECLSPVINGDIKKAENCNIQECLSPVINGDIKKAENCNIQEWLSPLINEDIKKAANCDIQGTWQKLWSIKVRLIPVFVTTTIIIVVITISAVVPRSGEKSTTGTENPIYRYAECMDDWFFYKGKCYYFSDKRNTWKDSQNYCKSHNSSLAIIDSKEELDFLNRHKCNENYWIGLSRVKDVYNWTWTNDTPYTETIFAVKSLETASGDLEHAFLNNDGVKSGIGRHKKQWICNHQLELL